MFDRTQFLKQQKDKLQDKSLSAALHLKAAAVPLQHLTRSDDWNRYLQMLQGELETARMDESALMKKLSGYVVNVDALMTIKMQLAAAQATCTTLEKIIALPQQIMDAAARLNDNDS